MGIHITCPGCRMQFQVKDELAGKRIRCLNKSCAIVFVVSTSPTVESPGGKSGGEPMTRGRTVVALIPIGIGIAVVLATLLMKALGVSLPFLYAACPVCFLLGIAGLINPEVLECAMADVGVGEKTKDSFSKAARASYAIALGAGLALGLLWIVYLLIGSLL